MKPFKKKPLDKPRSTLKKGVTAIRSFEYLGNSFEALRDFIAVEESFENLSRCTKDFKSLIYVTGYSHVEFFKKAQAAKAFFDLYVMNCSQIVTPGLRGFYVFDLSVPLLSKSTVVYSECCGQAIGPTERQQCKRTGPYICPLCKKPVTITGKVKKL